MSFNPFDWYWLAKDGRVFASARQTTVTTSDAGYGAFLDAGNVPTPWPVDATGAQTDAALQAVLTPYGLFVSQAAALLAYANTRQWSLATGGYTLTLSGQALTFSTDTESQSLITGKYVRLAQPNPPASISWQFASGFVSIAATDFQKAAVAIADFIQATFDALAQVLAAIKGGTIATTAAIDGFAWPSAIAVTT